MNKLKTASTVLALVILAGTSIQAPAQGKAPQGRAAQHSIHDANGDGICDACGQPVGSGQVDGKGQKSKKGKHFGPGDGTGNMGSGPQDGMGYGAKSGKRLGPQDGSQAGMGRKGNAQPRGAMTQSRRGGRP